MNQQQVEAGADEAQLLREQLGPLDEMVHGFDFTRMLRRYRSAYLESDEEGLAHVVKWLRGEYRTKTEARGELGSSTTITDDD